MDGQSIERIEINGAIIALNEDVEGVTIYNTSSNKGVVTNSKGDFTIAVAVNDVLEVSALQFETLTIKITTEIIKSKFLKIYLSEQINQLDTVLLKSGLSGVLALDIEEAKERPNITIALGNIDAQEFFDEKAFDNQVIEDALNSMVNKGMLYNGINLGAISKMLFKQKKRKTLNGHDFDNKKTIRLTDVYSNKTLSETYQIPLGQVDAFAVFVEANGLNYELLKEENELILIEFLLKQRELFLNSDHAKN